MSQVPAAPQVHRPGRISAPGQEGHARRADTFARHQPQVCRFLAHLDVELGVKSLLEQMSAALAGGDRIEIRGFGSFSLHYRPPRMGRNPKTGREVEIPPGKTIRFKPGKALRDMS